MNNGWIKLHRSLLDWEWIQNTNVFSIFVYCLLRANHEDKKWQGVLVERGTFITSYQKLSDELSNRYNKFSIQQVRTALGKLQLTGEVTIKPTTKYTLVKVNNWDKYQGDNTPTNTPITNKQQTNNKQITTNKNDKNVKNDKKESRFAPPSLSAIQSFVESNNYGIDSEAFLNHYEANGWYRGKTKIKDWKACVRTWQRKLDQQNPTGKIQRLLSQYLKKAKANNEYQERVFLPEHNLMHIAIDLNDSEPADYEDKTRQFLEDKSIHTKIKQYVQFK